MIKGIPMNSVYLGQPFTLPSSNNNLWVSMFKDKKYCTVFGSILSTPLLSFPLFRLANILNLGGSFCYVETEISVSPYSAPFRRKALRVIVVLFTNTIYGAFIFSVAIKKHLSTFRL